MNDIIHKMIKITIELYEVLLTIIVLGYSSIPKHNEMKHTHIILLLW